MRNILFYLVFSITLIPLFITLIVPLWILRFLKRESVEKCFLKKYSLFYFRFVIRMTGSRIIVDGLENLPDPASSIICLVSNHQSYFDILLIEAYIPFLVGFVAKSELGKVPVLRTWMRELGCVLIDRKSPKSAIEAINRGVESIKSGRPLVLFPEGTRSKDQKMNMFKPGSLKLAIRAKAVIVPLTINYSYKIYEEHSKVQPADVSLVIHKPVDTALSENSDSQELAGKLQSIIESALITG